LVRLGLVCLFSQVFSNNELNCHLKIWGRGVRLRKDMKTRNERERYRSTQVLNLISNSFTKVLALKKNTFLCFISFLTTNFLKFSAGDEFGETFLPPYLPPPPCLSVSMLSDEKLINLDMTAKILHVIQ
jgi:hypothetical protein